MLSLRMLLFTLTLGSFGVLALVAGVQSDEKKNPAATPAPRDKGWVKRHDGFVDIALAGDREVIFSLNGYRFDYGTGNAKTGYGAAADIGFRFGNIEPQANAYWFNSDNKNTGQMLRWAVGVNYFFRAHATKISAEFASQIVNGRLSDTPAGPATPALHQIVVQSQLSF